MHRHAEPATNQTAGKGGGDVCPMKFIRMLDNPLRRWLLQQKKMVDDYVRPGMTVLDAGCGPAPLLKDLDRAVGPGGRIICADVQQGMLDYVERKIRRARLQSDVSLRLCDAARIGLEPASVDLVIAFFLLHETPSPQNFIREMAETLKPGGQLFIAEPKHHVKAEDIDAYLRFARDAGLELVEYPNIRMSRTIVLRRPDA